MVLHAGTPTLTLTLTLAPTLALTTGMFLHADTLRTSGWQMQIRGRKRWHLCPGPGGFQAAILTRAALRDAWCIARCIAWYIAWSTTRCITCSITAPRHRITCSITASPAPSLHCITASRAPSLHRITCCAAQAASHTYCGAAKLDTFDPDYRDCRYT